MTRADADAAPESGEIRPADKAFYTFDADQSARVERIVFACRGLSELACSELDEMLGGEAEAVPEVTMTRKHLSAVFAMIADSIDAAVGPDAVGSVWLDPHVLRSKARH